jgi:molecular chaperone GrpE
MQEENLQAREGQNEGPKPGQGSEKSLEALLAEAQAKIEQQRDAMLRAVAEAENVRKRTLAEAATTQKYAVERFAEGLLPVVDSLEAAIATKDTSGVELTLKQFLSALEKVQVVPVAPQPGERFDPYRHQAMAAVPSAQEPNTVVAVMQKGYLLHDRVLRPALVTVAKAVEKPAGNPTSETDSN